MFIWVGCPLSLSLFFPLSRLLLQPVLDLFISLNIFERVGSGSSNLFALWVRGFLGLSSTALSIFSRSAKVNTLRFLLSAILPSDGWKVIAGSDSSPLVARAYFRLSYNRSLVQLRTRDLLSYKRTFLHPCFLQAENSK